MEIDTKGGVLVEVNQRAFFRYPKGPSGRCYVTGQRFRLPPALAKRLAFPPDGSRACLKIVAEGSMTGLEEADSVAGNK